MSRYFLALTLLACGSSKTTGSTIAVPTTYEFPSRFDANKSSVKYAGQTFRHLMIDEMKQYVGSLKTAGPRSAVQVSADLEFFYAFDAMTGGTLPLMKTTTPGHMHSNYSALSPAKLTDKIAGKDLPAPYRNFDAELIGWGTPGQYSPESLVRHWFTELAALVEQRSSASPELGADGQPISEPFVTVTGLNYQELLAKFLLGAVAYSQGTDDYLDDATPGEGLLADNQDPDGQEAYTKLEHKWDEAFGWFGAARDYGRYSDAEVTAGVLKDSNGDGLIDLRTEHTWGHAQNASKRDAAANEATDLSGEAWSAFLKGRAIIAGTPGNLDVATLDTLKAQRDIAVAAWEKAIASTVVHYINQTLADMAKFGTSSYTFSAHAKHWSEMKGFALNLQFNPRAKLSASEQIQLHARLRQAPVLPGSSEVAAYQTSLREAKAQLQAAYGFAAANMGDDNGAGGW